MIPAGYTWRTGRGGEGIALKEAAAWLQALLDSDTTVHGWAAVDPEANTHAGRGVVHSIPAPFPGPDTRARWAVRHYRRGGLIAPLLGDRYPRARTTRPERELHASCEARSRGVPTPAVVAAVWYPAGAFYRADLVTELLPDAVTLADALFEEERGPEAIARLRAAGGLVRLAADRGLSHPDLNARNVIFSPAASTHEVHLVDLDRARVTASVGTGAGARMLSRLRRSLDKIGTTSRRPLSREEIDALKAGYGS